jgi:hypothetical protein
MGSQIRADAGILATFRARAFAFRPKLRSAPIVAGSAAAEGVPETADGRRKHDVNPR